MKEIQADPKVGLAAAIEAVPELASARDAQAAILAATIATWEGPVQKQHGLGALDLAGWQASIPYFESLGIIKKPVTVQDLVRTDLLPAGG